MLTWRILHECSCIIEFIKEVGEKIRCEALPSILSSIPNEFNKFNNTGARRGEDDKMRGCAEHLIKYSPTSLINSIIQEHECKIRARFFLPYGSVIAISYFRTNISNFRY